MLKQEEIEQQQSLLEAHRSTLVHLVRQAAKFGGLAFAPPATMHGIAEARADIARVKATLRENGVEVDEHPDDVVTPDGGAGPARSPSSHQQHTLTISGNAQVGMAIAGNVHGDIHHHHHSQPRPVIDPDEAQRLLDSLPLDDIPGPAPALPAGSLMPLAANPLFVGREQELRTLARTLKAGGTTAISPLVAATGLGGIGKTQLAVEFVYRYGCYFAGGVFWLSFADAASVPGEMARCGGAGALDLQLDFAALKQDDQLRLVQAAWHSPIPRLLIFDNCEDEMLLAQWRPPHGGCWVLITSRRAAWDTSLAVQTLPLGVLPRSESIALLTKFRSALSADDPYLVDIAAELGDLPLALYLAGSFLKLYPETSPAEYLAELRSAALLKHESLQGIDLTVSPTNHELHVGRSFAISYDQLDATKAIDTLALALLKRTACFASGEPIPRDLLLATIELPDATARRKASRALNRLTALGLLDSERDNTLRLHRLLAAFVDDITSDTNAQEAVEQAMLDTANQLNNAGYPAPLRVLQVHLRQITDRALLRADERAADLANTLGYHLQMTGDLTGARPYYEQALAISLAVLGEKHPDTANSLNNLGSLLLTQGDLAGARPYFEQALPIYREVLGEKHPDTASILSNLGALLHNQGDLAGAHPYFEQALTIRQEVLGERHPDTARSLNNLGYLLQAQGNLTGARPFYEQALAIKREVLGEHHPLTALSLNSLGYLLDAQGDLDAARPYFEQALAIRREVLGERHSDTARSLNNLGALLRAQGDLAGARPYYEQALAIRREVLGERHPDTANSLNNLGALLQAQGDLDAARPYFEQTLVIYREVLGERHSDTAQSLNNLGGLLHDQGDLDAARPYFEQALAIYREVLGERHSDTAQSLNNLGGLLHDQGDLDAARPYFEQALAIRREVLGERHPDIATSLNNLGALLRAQGDLAGARAYYEQALAIWQEVLGEWHPDTATSLNNLGGLIQAQGDLVGAHAYYKQALAIRREVLGETHPDTASSLWGLGRVIAQEGARDRARQHLQRAVAIFQHTLGEQHPTTQECLGQLAAFDAPPQTPEQHIVDITAQAETAVIAALADPTSDRAALVERLETIAQQIEDNEPEGSPYLALATHLRALAARLTADESASD